MRSDESINENDKKNVAVWYGTLITLYSEIVTTDYHEKLQNMDMVQEFYNYQILEEIIQEVTDD